MHHGFSNSVHFVNYFVLHLYVHKRHSFKEVLLLDGKAQQMHSEGISSPANGKEEINNWIETYSLIRCFRSGSPTKTGCGLRRILVAMHKGFIQWKFTLRDCKFSWRTLRICKTKQNKKILLYCTIIKQLPHWHENRRKPLRKNR